MSLGKGLRIERYDIAGAAALICQDPSLPMVQFAFGLRHGAWADTEGQSGATHVLFELMARGTATKTRSEFNEALESMGSSLGVTVTQELAFFRCVCLKRYFSQTVELLMEMLHEPALDPIEFDTLVQECQQELEAERDEDDSLAALFFRKYLFQDHLLARDPAGTISSMGTLTVSTIRELHRERFNACEHLWFFGGDFDPQIALSFVEQAAKELSGNVPHLPVVAPSRHCVPKLVVVDKPGRTQVQMRIGAPLVHGLHEDVDSIWLGVVAFGGIFTSPFTQEIRDSRGWSYFASASFEGSQRNVAPIVFSTATGLDDAVDCLELQFRLYEELAREGLESSQLEHTRSYLLKRYPFDIATAGSLLVPALRTELLGKSSNAIFEFPDRLRALEARDIVSALKRNLSPGPSVAVAVGQADYLVPHLNKRFPKCNIESVSYREGL